MVFTIQMVGVTNQESTLEGMDCSATTAVELLKELLTSVRARPIPGALKRSAAPSKRAPAEGVSPLGPVQPNVGPGPTVGGLRQGRSRLQLQSKWLTENHPHPTTAIRW